VSKRQVVVGGRKKLAGPDVRSIQLSISSRQSNRKAVVRSKILCACLRASPDNNTVNTTCPALGGGDMLRAKASAKGSLNFTSQPASTARYVSERYPATHSRNGIPSTLNVHRRPSRAFNGHSRRAGVGALWSAHLHTRRCWIASMEETRFPSSARTSKQGRRRCWKEIGREEVWW
jgi:hypothetical protein